MECEDVCAEPWVVDSSEAIAVRVARRGFAAQSKRVPDQYHFTVLGVLFVPLRCQVCRKSSEIDRPMLPVTHEVAGSSPVVPASWSFRISGIETTKVLPVGRNRSKSMISLTAVL